MNGIRPCMHRKIRLPVITQLLPVATPLLPATTLLFAILLLVGCRVREHEYFITAFGARGDGSTLCTGSIQRAIDACHKAGGGTVVVPAGNFVTGTMVLKSDVEFHLQQGARLVGSPDTADYRVGGQRRGMVFAYQAKHITLSGEGEICGRGSAFHRTGRAHMGQDFDRRVTRQGEDYLPAGQVPGDGPIAYDYRPGMLVVILQCEQVAIKDLTFRDSPEWTFRIADCDNVSVTGISILNNLMIPNSDGIHCTTSRNVRISGCDIRAGDDAIIVTGFGTLVEVGGDINTRLDYSTREYGNKTGYAENVTVTNCILQSRSAGIRVGYGINPIRNCVFSNLVIHDSNRGIGVFSRDDGSIEDILFSDIIIKNRLHSGHWWGNGEPIHVSAVKQDPDIPAGPVRNIRFRNIIAESESGILIYGTEESPVKNVQLEDVSIHIARGTYTDSYGGNFDLRPVYTTDLGVFRHDIPALYSQYTEGLTIRDLTVSWGNDLPLWMTQAVHCTDFTNLTIDGFYGAPARAGLPAIWLEDGSGASLEHIRGSSQGLRLVQQRNVAE
jgi:polygalacturonase